MASDARIEFNGHTLEYVDSNHAYKLDGQRVPSGSTIASVAYQSVDALMGWANKLGREGKSHTEERDLSAVYGNVAHAQLEALAKTGEPLDPKDQPEQVQGILQGIARWYFEWRPKFLGTELMVASVKHQFAGRYDVKCELKGGELAMVDLKSSGPDLDWQKWYSRRGGSAFCQLALYAIADYEMHGIKLDSRYVLRVGADGVVDFEKDHAPENSERAALAKLAVYNADKERGRAYTAAKKLAA